tara:strand:+ start:8299 stop:10539 length:2241 start_codon:yes stop_codon:yes gene_type:complete
MHIYINDKKYEVNENDTIIQVADRHEIHIPRFCYHKRLSIVASCRMCLVDVEGAKYPQPACSTIVRDGMKVNTTNATAVQAQKNTMEFLLINHPLDCPICDQAGECELQDVSLEHGDYKSSYNEIKRTVIDKDIGELVSTEMTRCIHCSRCVRFGEEVAGMKELGMTGRGEETKIETFINQGLSSQLSGNVIDLCPVGALNNSLYKYSARTWDLKQTSSISSNDCLGSNIYYHTYNDEIKRCIPKEDDEINLSWLSDNDRFGYEGIKSEERVLHPLIRKSNNLERTDFNTISEYFIKSLRQYQKKSCGIMSAQSSCEEMFLFQHLLRQNDVEKIDHRSMECDFRYQNNFPAIPSFDIKLSDIKNIDNIIIVGANISKEFPILSIYFREAIKNNSTSISSFATYEFEENFSLKKFNVLNSQELEDIFDKSVTQATIDIDKKKNNLILIGPAISYLSNYSNILNNVSKYAESLNAKLALLGDQANTSGAWAMGIVPHRLPGGTTIDKFNKSSNYELLSDSENLIVIYNLEPEYDFSDDNKILEKLKNSDVNIFFSSYITESIEKYADVVFPLSTHVESCGSYLNINKKLQYFNKVINPLGESMDGSNILLKLCNSLDNNLTYDSVKMRVRDILGQINVNDNYIRNTKLNKVSSSKSLEKIVIRNPNSSNPTLRRCNSLLNTHDNDDFFSLPSDKISSEKEKIVLNENNNKLKFTIKQKTHSKPANTVLIKVGGTHKHKIGAYNTEVEL